jgi:hypothetical protein
MQHIMDMRATIALFGLAPASRAASLERGAHPGMSMPNSNDAPHDDALARRDPIGGDQVGGDKLSAGDISGSGVAIGAGTSVRAWRSVLSRLAFRLVVELMPLLSYTYT